MKSWLDEKSVNHKNRFGPLNLRKKDFFLTLAPVLLWVGATYARPAIIQTRCALNPQTCSKESVLSIDQLSLGMEDWKADEYSYFTQNLSGVLAVVVPPAWNVTLFALGRLSPWAALSAAGIDLVIFSQTVSWNGFFTEFSHLIAQRPRPFVYSDPQQRGTDPAHYTSFYSGHTSFAATASTYTFLILLSQEAPVALLLIWGIIMECLIFSTGYFRILAGRHFLTDVICGSLAGSLIALTVFYTHIRTSKKKQVP